MVEGCGCRQKNSLTALADLNCNNFFRTAVIGKDIAIRYLMDFYIIHGLILCLWQTLKKGQNLFGILVSSLQLTELNAFSYSCFLLDIYNTLK